MTNWTSGVSEANGIDIHYLRTSGSKPPLVLLHGLTASGACWIPLARALEGDYDVVMPDARGHGNSSTPLKGYRYQDHAGDVVGLIQGLRLAAPVLLGHSMGGMTAAVIASQTATAIRGVILADPNFLEPRASARSSRERCRPATPSAPQFKQERSAGSIAAATSTSFIGDHRTPGRVEAANSNRSV
jgi:pimeloyl-ACP methyl ester carboxylesterase